MRKTAPLLITLLMAAALAASAGEFKDKGETIAADFPSGWNSGKSDDPTVTLKLEKGKYYVEIRLPYSAEGYSIEYLTSTKLNYRLEAPSTAPNVFPTPGVEVDPNAKPVAMIHPGYMRWIAILTKTVNAQLIAMVAEP